MAAAQKKNMKKYLAVFLGTEAAMKRFEKLPLKTRRELEEKGMQAWGQWVKKNSKSIVDLGAPLGTTKHVDRKGTRNASNQLAAYTVVQASSHAAAAKLFKNHPHFMIFPGDSVEIMECLPVPL